MAAYSGQNVEHLIRNVQQTPRRLRYANERNDQVPLATTFAASCYQRRGEDDIEVARIGRDLVAAPRLIGTTTDHPYRVMVNPARRSYHRSEVAETVRHSDPAPKSARSHATTDGIRSIRALADV